MTSLEKMKRDAEEAAELAKQAAKRVADAEYAILQAKQEPLKELVIKAHDILCRWNHTDGCSWGYESANPLASPGEHNAHDWNGWAHQRWLKHIAGIVEPDSYSKEKPVPVATLHKLLDLIAELKKVDDSALWIIRHRLEP